MNIGSLTIELAANVARLTQDMQAARGVVERNAQAMQKAADLAGKALGALGVGLSLAAFTGFIRGAIDAADAAGKLSASTGIAVKDLAGLQMTYEQGGLGQDVFAKSTAKLSKAIADGSVALDAMGVKTRDAAGNLRSTKDVIYEVSDKFADYADGANKAALAQEIFGKSGAEMIPLLNAGSAGMIAAQEAAEQLGLTISEGTAAKAAEFNDTLDTLQRGLGGVATRVAAELVPTLSTLAGELLTTTTNSGVLEGAASALSGALKGLYSVGVGVFEVFKTVGTALGGVGAGIAALMRGEFAQANAIGNQLAKDIGESWAASGRTIQNVWSGAGNAVVDSVVKSGAAAKAQAPNVAALTAAHAAGAAAAKKAAAEAEKAAEAARKLVAEGVKLAASLLAVDGGLSGDFAEKWAKLNTAFRAGALSLADLTKAQSLLLAEQPAMKAAVEERKKQLDDEAAAWADVRKAMAAYGQAQEQAAQGVADGNKSLREEIELIGLSSKEQTRVLQQRTQAIVLTKQHTLAEMERQAVITGTMTREQIALAAEIEGLQERNELLGAQEARESWTGFWESVNSTAHDTFVNVAEEGMGAFKRIGKTLKSAVLDMLYQMTVKKWIISISGSVAGGAANAATGSGGGLGTLSNIGSLASGAGLLGAGGLGMQAGFGALMSSGFAGIGASVTGGMAAIASGTGAGIAAGLGTIAGALGPIAAGAALLWQPLFGRKLKDSGIEGNFGGASGFEGNSYQYLKGGLFRSDKTKRGELDDGLQDYLSQSFKLLQTQTGTFAETLGLQSDKVASFTSAIKLSLKDLNEAEATAALEGAVKQAGNDLAQTVLGTDAFSKAGEAAGDTLARLAVSLSATNGWLDTLGLALKEASLASASASSNFIELFGSMDTFSASMASYYENFYSEAERMGKATASLTEELAKSGVSMPASKEAYRALVEEQLAAGEGGAELAAKLLLLNGVFAEVTDYAEQAAKDAEQAAKDTAQAAKDAITSLLDAVGIGAADMGKTFRDVLLGRTDAAEAGAALADSVTGGIYNALAGGFADQLTQLMTTQLIQPVIQAAVAGASISEAVSQSAIDSMVAQARAAADALGRIFNDPAFRSAVDSIGAAITGALGAAGEGYKPARPQASTGYAERSFAEATVQPVKEAWRDLLEGIVRQTQDATRELSRLGMTSYEAALASIADKARDQLESLFGAGYRAGERTNLADAQTAFDNASSLVAFNRAQGYGDDDPVVQRGLDQMAQATSEISRLSALMGSLTPEIQAWVGAETALLEARNARTAADTVAGLAKEVERLGFGPLEKELASIADRSAEYVSGLQDLGQGTQANIAAVKAWQDAMAGAALSADAAAKAAQAAADAERLAADRAGATDKAYAALERAVGAQRDLLQETMGNLQAVFDLAADASKALYAEVESTSAQAAQAGKAFIDQALSNAKASGYLPDADGLREAIEGARNGMQKQQYASSFEAERDRLVLAGKLQELSDIAGPQLTEAQRQLKVLEDTLLNARAQIDVLRGIDVSVLRVADAVSALAAAMAAEKAGVAGAGGGGSSIAGTSYVNSLGAAVGSSVDRFINGTYQKLFGRDADAAGLAYYRDIMVGANGNIKTDAHTIENAIKAGAQGADKPGLAPMASPLPAFDNRALLQSAQGNARLEGLVQQLTAEVVNLRGEVAEGTAVQRTTADILDNVTEGGNGMRSVAIGGV